MMLPKELSLFKLDALKSDVFYREIPEDELRSAKERDSNLNILWDTGERVPQRGDMMLLTSESDKEPLLVAVTQVLQGRRYGIENHRVLIFAIVLRLTQDNPQQQRTNTDTTQPPPMPGPNPNFPGEPADPMVPPEVKPESSNSGGNNGKKH